MNWIWKNKLLWTSNKNIKFSFKKRICRLYICYRPFHLVLNVASQCQILGVYYLIMEDITNLLLFQLLRYKSFITMIACSKDQTGPRGQSEPTQTPSWRRHQMGTFSALLALCDVNPPVTQWRGVLICARTNGWAKNRDTGDLRRHGAHYDVTVMCNLMLLHCHGLKCILVVKVF